MQTSPYTSTGPGTWHRGQSTAQQHLQLEEEDPYLLASHDASQAYLQVQPRASGTQRMFNRYLPSSQNNSLASNQYDSDSAYQQQHSFAPSSMTSSQGPSSNAFTFTPQGYNPNSTQSEYQTSFASGMNASTAPVARNPTSTNPSGPGFPMQFPYTLQPPTRQSDVQSQVMNQMAATMARQSAVPLPKRQREDDAEEHSSPEGHQELPDTASRPRPTGACARCKSLKVRCEFRGNNDTCKRCISAGQECVIPGRKPRRTPPKREFLLKQIREQAAQIQDLMAQLPATNQRAVSHSVSSPSTLETQLSPSSSADLHSPTLDHDGQGDSAPPKPEVQDWITKARASIEAFGGLIALGGQAKYGNPENSAESDEEEITFDSDYETEDDAEGYATADEGGRNRRSQSPFVALKKNQLTDQKGILPPAASPFGLMAHLAIRKNGRGKSAEPEPQDAVGVASANFFTSAPDPLRSNPSTNSQFPHILTRDVITVGDAENLFKLYFDKMNMSASLMDPVLHTPQYVAMRSPFLFTVVCAVASRFYAERKGLYAEVMRYAQLAAGTALISGPKNEEMCLAYLLLQLYPVPSRRWEEDRSWVFLGVAIRLAQDLNLHRPRTATPLNEHHARVLNNRTRVWVNCFNLDRSTGSQYGKAPIIPNTDYIANHLDDWWHSSKYNIEHFDIHICIYSMELNIGAKFQAKIRGDPNNPSGFNISANLTQLASDTDDELARVGNHWFKRLDEFETSSPLFIFRTGLLKMAFSYSRLVALSFGLQHAKEDYLDENSFLMRCFMRASDVINAFVNRLYTTPEERVFLRHAPEAQYVFVSFAGAFLVKLLQPKYAQYFTYDQRVEIRDLVQKTVNLLGAPDVALDEKHGPYLYSRFLAGLLASPAVKVDLSPTSATSPGHKRLRKPKTPPAKTQGGFLTDTPGSGSTGDPSPSCSPTPSYIYPHVDAFTTIPSQDQIPAGINISNMFNNPIPMTLDTDLLESAQIMNDPLWQDNTIPGFQWMGQMHSYTSDYSMYDPQQFGPMT